jgi:hypothetical protein
MIARAVTAGVAFKWVAGDTVYGIGDIERQLRRAGKNYVPGSAALMCFNPGVSSLRSPARQQRSPESGARPTGSACRQGTEPKDRGYGVSRIGRARGRTVQRLE